MFDLHDLTPNRAFLLHEMWNFDRVMLCFVIENEMAKRSKFRMLGFRIPPDYFDQSAITIRDDVEWSVSEGLVVAWVNAILGPGEEGEARPQTTLTAHEVATILDPEQDWDQPGDQLAWRFILEITDAGIAAWELVAALSPRERRRLASDWKKAARSSSQPSAEDSGQFLRF